MGSMIELVASDGHKLAAYRAEPAGKPRGGVVVIQEIFGVNQHIREVADGYAADGYLAIAPAIFDRVKRGVEIGYTMPEIQEGFGYKGAVVTDDAMKDVQAAVNAASSAGKVGVVGYCFGGFLSWMSAARVMGLSASAPYYGGGVPDAAAENPQCPVMLHFGEKDSYIPMDSVNAFKAKHTSQTVHVYAADHGFNCNHRGSYDEAAAKLARERTLAFFRQHVG